MQSIGTCVVAAGTEELHEYQLYVLLAAGAVTQTPSVAVIGLLTKSGAVPAIVIGVVTLGVMVTRLLPEGAKLVITFTLLVRVTPTVMNLPA